MKYDQVRLAARVCKLPCIMKIDFPNTLTPGLRKTRGNLDYFGDIQKMKNSLRVEFLFSNAAIYFIKHLDSHCIFTTVLGTIALVKKGL